MQFPSQNPCEKLQTSLSARHVWESCSCRKRNHLDGRWELSKLLSSNIFWKFLPFTLLHKSVRLGKSEISSTLTATMRWKTGAQSCFLLRNWENIPALGKNSFACARAWWSSAHATQTMPHCWLCWGFSLRHSGFVNYCQIKIQNTNMYKIPNKREVYEELGWPWERFQEYIEHDLVSSMQSLHVELGSFWFPRLSMCALILWIPKTLMIMVVVPHTLQCEWEIKNL